jgi:hypothetical protein
MSKKKTKTKEKDFIVFASRSYFCKYNIVNVTDLDVNKACFCLLDTTQLEYCLVYAKSHLLIQKFDCGCLVYTNKYYPEFNFNKHIWNDFYSIKLNSGNKLSKISIKLLNNLDTNT